MTPNLSDYFMRHERAALMLSGGKDSTTALMLCRPWWDQITVYWSNPGAALPETIDQMARVRAMVPNFVEVRGDVMADIQQSGWPVDIVPHAMTPIGRMTSGTDGIVVRDRFACCYRNLMFPAYQQAVADGCTLIVRGERRAETNHNRSVSSGYIDENNVEHLLPIYDWPTEVVMTYLQTRAPELIHPAYAEGAAGNPDCVCCTAFWNEGYTPYLAKHHPEAAENRTRVIQLVTDTIHQTLEGIAP
jgi:3'-phosphoadenosine 5'-phosphosulfate sulfotransferase (PAPS reductase)/FAD synthetase